MRLVIHDDYGYTTISLYQGAYVAHISTPSSDQYGWHDSASTASVPPVPVLQKMFNSDNFALMAKVLERDFGVVDGWAELLRQMPHKRERIEQAFASVCTNRLLGGK